MSPETTTGTTPTININVKPGRGKSDLDYDRTLSPPRPSILLQDSFNLSKEQFNQSVKFSARKGMKEKISKTQDQFWDNSPVDFDNNIIRMGETD